MARRRTREETREYLRRLCRIIAADRRPVAVLTAAEEAGARTLVLTGAEGHFCAGADLTELEDVAFTERLAEVLAHLAHLPLVTIAAIEGSCMGLEIGRASCRERV